MVSLCMFVCVCVLKYIYLFMVSMEMKKKFFFFLQNFSILFDLLGTFFFLFFSFFLGPHHFEDKNSGQNLEKWYRMNVHKYNSICVLYVLMMIRLVFNHWMKKQKRMRKKERVQKKERYIKFFFNVFQYFFPTVKCHFIIIMVSELRENLMLSLKKKYR